MPHDRDHYEAYYRDKLWNLLPAVYRTEDTDVFDKPGPLRELVNRIGVQMAIVRRSIDRLWEDQSIETCDDWVIPYIGDLLATRLVASLDARGQRLDVAKTIYYRRRKGTVAVLEEIAADITGWEGRVVELFRRLSRTRHGLDPEIGLPSAIRPTFDSGDLEGFIGSFEFTFAAAGDFEYFCRHHPIMTGTVHVEAGGPPQVTVNIVDGPPMAFSPAKVTIGIGGKVRWENHSQFHHTVTSTQGAAIATRDLQIAQGLIGTSTGTAIGGWADLRNASASAKAHSAFDEFFYTADLRRGREQLGWYNIPRLGVFLWHLQSFGVDQTTPVAVQNCSGQYSFDPTGREIPLFAATSKTKGDEWVSPAEWQLPGAISKGLFLQETANLYPRSVEVLEPKGVSYETVDAAKLTLYPEIGRFSVDPSLKAPRVRYHYGFSATIGAGPYDRRLLGGNPIGTPDPISGGADHLVVVLGSVAPIGTVAINDSLTYDAVSDVGSPATGIQRVAIRAENKTRPLIRLPAPAPTVTEWAFTGPPEGGTLLLEGLFVTGGDIVLHGSFETVTLTCCTLDPGNSGAAEESTDPVCEGGGRQGLAPVSSLDRRAGASVDGHRLHRRADCHSAQRPDRDPDDHRQHRAGAG